MVVGAGGTHNEWAESFSLPPLFLLVIHEQQESGGDGEQCGKFWYQRGHGEIIADLA